MKVLTVYTERGYTPVSRSGTEVKKCLKEFGMMLERINLNYFEVTEIEKHAVYLRSIKTKRNWMIVELLADEKWKLEECYILFCQLKNGEYVSIRDFRFLEDALARIKAIDSSIVLKQAA